jgi:hypothetical protein
MALRCCDRGMNTVHFSCDEPAMKYCRSQSERAAIYVYRHSYSEPLLLDRKCYRLSEIYSRPDELLFSAKFCVNGENPKLNERPAATEN